ncbi:MAG: GntR family transcriptional regulator [Lactobacillales bacterium]|jgi:GntR family transcriptional regulator|nr:GntR family transcriptional regulator [Lactobacillales bacterium]
MVSINKSKNKPLYEQIMFSIKEDILHQILLPGEKLPSVRELSTQLMMNPNTISKAYKLLEQEKVLVTVKGKGTYVNDEISSKRNQIKVDEIHQKFNELLIEANYWKIKRKEIIGWVNKSFNMEENTDGNSES